MELVECVARSDFYDSRAGDVIRKQRLKLPRYVAEQLETIRLVTIVSVPIKAAPKIPALLIPLQSGPTESLVWSAADHPLPKKTARRSRKGKPKTDGESSQ
jgi:hypothetical protein